MPKAINLTASQLNQLIDEVATGVESLMKAEAEAEAQKLSKADPGEEATGEKKPEGSSAEPAPEASASPEASGPPAGDEGSAPPPGGDEGSAPPPDAASGDPAADAMATPEALEAEYAKLPDQELQMHFVALRSALMKRQTVQPDAGAPDAGAGPPPEASGSPAGAPPPPPPEASGPPAMGKGEIKLGDGSGGKMTAGKMSKSEVEAQARLVKAEADQKALAKTVADQAATIQALEANIGNIAAAVKNRLERPIRKSATGVSFVTKPGTTADASTKFESLSKSEIVKKLNEVTSSASLSKKDRDLVNSYCVGTVSIKEIAHLLTE